MNIISYIRAYLTGPTLYRIYRQARLVSTLITYISKNSFSYNIKNCKLNKYELNTNIVKIHNQGQGYVASEQYNGNAGERYGGMVMSCVSI